VFTVSARILVLGASGFIGRHLIDACRARGFEVIGTSRGSSRELIRLDPLGPNAFERVLEAIQPSAIVNCIGATAGSRDEFLAANVGVVSRLLEVVGLETCPNQRLVQLGSAAEFGAVEFGAGISPTAPTNPVNGYGATKLEATRLVAQARERGVQGVVLRLFNPLGPGLPDSSLPGRAVARIRNALEHHERAIRFGSLRASRDFVDVRDVVDALIAAATLETTPPPILNLGSGTATSARELVRTLAQIAGYDGQILEDDTGSPRAGEIAWQRADVSLTVSSLGWEPRRGLRESLEWMWSLSGR
jgi:nucleoside-diphosphate-sugar epimerase